MACPPKELVRSKRWSSSAIQCSGPVSRAVGVLGIGWIAGALPADAVVIGLAVQLITVLEKLLLAREASRRDAVAWKGAVELSKAGGDGAAVARALRKRSAEPDTRR